MPLWDGELYLEYHRGTYTSQARNKRNNRKLENALGQLEWLSVLSRLAGGAYPAQRIHDCWETVLRDQFHDIIPGSSIHEVYEDTRKEYEALWREVDAMEKKRLKPYAKMGMAAAMAVTGMKAVAIMAVTAITATACCGLRTPIVGKRC